MPCPSYKLRHVRHIASICFYISEWARLCRTGVARLPAEGGTIPSRRLGASSSGEPSAKRVGSQDAAEPGEVGLEPIRIVPGVDDPVVVVGVVGGERKRWQRF